MSNIVTIGSVTTAVISYKGQHACTTQQLAQFYGCTEKHLSDNYANNRDRFEEGKHFIKLQGEDLQALKNKPEIIGLVAKKARHVILWTERGAARHAKMLETDQAWEVFEQLEDSYFTAAATRGPVVDGHKRSNAQDRLPLYHFAIDTVIKHRLMFSKVYTLINLYAGSPNFQQMTKEQSAQVADFCDRFALGQDTRNDWQRITDNKTRMHGESPQLDMVQKLLLS